MENKFTQSKYSFGVSGEFAFQAYMDINYQLQLENLNDTNKLSAVDFHVPNTNVYIELKTRTCTSTAFKTTFFDVSKVNNWIKNKHYRDAVIYIAFAFHDGFHFFIKYNPELFEDFDKHPISEWNQINYKIPLKECIDINQFITEINELKSNCVHAS